METAHNPLERTLRLDHDGRWQGVAFRLPVYRVLGAIDTVVDMEPAGRQLEPTTPVGERLLLSISRTTIDVVVVVRHLRHGNRVSSARVHGVLGQIKTHRTLDQIDRVRAGRFESPESVLLDPTLARRVALEPARTETTAAIVDHPLRGVVAGLVRRQFDPPLDREAREETEGMPGRDPILVGPERVTGVGDTLVPPAASVAVGLDRSGVEHLRGTLELDPLFSDTEHFDLEGTARADLDRIARALEHQVLGRGVGRHADGDIAGGDTFTDRNGRLCGPGDPRLGCRGRRRSGRWRGRLSRRWRGHGRLLGATTPTTAGSEEGGQRGRNGQLAQIRTPGRGRVESMVSHG